MSNSHEVTLRTEDGRQVGVPEDKFACLTYHHIGDQTNQYTVSVQQFRTQLAFLQEAGYFVEGFEQLESRVVSKCSFPPRYAVLTIDDGHESAMAAAELLSKHSLNATFFVTRDLCLAKSGCIRTSQIQELRRAGFSVGTHGTTHKLLTQMPAGTCADELRESKEWLEDVLSEPVRYMSAPGGYVNSKVLSLAYAHGYTLAGTCREQMNSIRVAVPGIVSRVNVRRSFSEATFKRLVQGSGAFYAFRQIRSAALWIPKELFAWRYSRGYVGR
jgi:peptidoglycan/xylan/chitin deacetylase (PgdA/CDA1 family)